MHSAEAVAVALLRLYRANLPQPEKLREPAPDAREEGRRTAPDATRTEWFRIGIGRRRNADPKWLLPMICRLGDVTRADIGAIRVLDHETRFEVLQSAIAGFKAALQHAGEHEMRIEPSEKASSAPREPHFTKRRKRAPAK